MKGKTNKEFIEYLVFAGFKDYTGGGIEDLYMVSSDLEKIKEVVERSRDNFDWCQIVNRKTLKMKMFGERYKSMVDGKLRWKWEYKY